jgi:hypothetical protein
MRQKVESIDEGIAVINRWNMDRMKNAEAMAECYRKQIIALRDENETLKKHIVTLTS